MEGVKKLEKQIRQHYYPGYKAAQQLGISSHLLSRITGTMFVLKGPKEAEVDHAGKVNIGLNLKNNKKGEEVCGYTRKSHDNNWLCKCLELVCILAPYTFEVSHGVRQGYWTVRTVICKKGQVLKSHLSCHVVSVRKNYPKILRYLLFWAKKNFLNSSLRLSKAVYDRSCSFDIRLKPKFSF